MYRKVCIPTGGSLFGIASQRLRNAAVFGPLTQHISEKYAKLKAPLGGLAETQI